MPYVSSLIDVAAIAIVVAVGCESLKQKDEAFDAELLLVKDASVAVVSPLHSRLGSIERFSAATARAPNWRATTSRAGCTEGPAADTASASVILPESIEVT